MIAPEDVAAAVLKNQPCAHNQEHWEVTYQPSAGAAWKTWTDGPHVKYPDFASADKQALRISPLMHCVRVKHVMTDWYLPGATAAP